MTDSSWTLDAYSSEGKLNFLSNLDLFPTPLIKNCPNATKKWLRALPYAGLSRDFGINAGFHDIDTSIQSHVSLANTQCQDGNLFPSLTNEDSLTTDIFSVTSNLVNYSRFDIANDIQVDAVSDVEVYEGTIPVPCDFNQDRCLNLKQVTNSSNDCIQNTMTSTVPTPAISEDVKILSKDTEIAAKELASGDYSTVDSKNVLIPSNIDNNISSITSTNKSFLQSQCESNSVESMKNLGSIQSGFYLEPASIESGTFNAVYVSATMKNNQINGGCGKVSFPASVFSNVCTSLENNGAYCCKPITKEVGGNLTTIPKRLIETKGKRTDEICANPSYPSSVNHLRLTKSNMSGEVNKEMEIQSNPNQKNIRITTRELNHDINNKNILNDTDVDILMGKKSKSSQQKDIQDIVMDEIIRQEINQTIFAKVSIGKTQGYLSELLKRSKELEKKGERDNRRMRHNFDKIRMFLKKPKQDRTKLYTEFIQRNKKETHPKAGKKQKRTMLPSDTKQYLNSFFLVRNENLTTSDLNFLAEQLDLDVLIIKIFYKNWKQRQKK